MNASMKGVGKTVTKGAKEVVSPEALAATGGVLGEWYLEKTLLSTMPGWFGVDDGSTPLGPGYTWARQGMRAGMAVLCGTLATGAVKLGSPKISRAAGLGGMAMAIKHILDGFGLSIG